MSPGREQRGLGRGLGALIPQGAGRQQGGSQDIHGAGEQLPTTRIVTVPVADISPNPRQPRTAIPPETLVELAASIREHGVIQPLIVTRSPGGEPTPYQLVAGERRWRAAQLAGLTAVPALITEATSQQQLELALVENLQRSDLNALEEAVAYQALMAEFGLTQHEVAVRVGRSRVAVANSVRLLRLPQQVKALLAEAALSEGHARALLGLPDDETIVQAAEQVVARELTVRQTEELVRRLAAVADAADAVAGDALPADDPYKVQTRQLEEAFRSALGTKVALTRSQRGGRLVIHFYSDEELQSLYEQLVGEG